MLVITACLFALIVDGWLVDQLLVIREHGDPQQALQLAHAVPPFNSESSRCLHHHSEETSGIGTGITGGSVAGAPSVPSFC